MPYARWDDKFHRHPKRLLLCAAADGMSLRASSYIAEHLTDGFVPAKWLTAQIFQHAEAMELSPRAEAKERARLLAEITKPLPPRGMPVFEAVEGGYMLHDYLEHNPTAAEVEAQRAGNRKRKSASRSSGHGVTTPQSVPGGHTVTPGSGSGVGEETAEEQAPVTRAPAPDERTPTDDVLGILASCDRIAVNPIRDRFSVENAVQAVGGWGQCDPIAAAREAVVVASDPVWNLTDPGRLMLQVLRKQKQQPARPARPEADDDRRARLHAEADRLEAEEAAQR